MISLCAFHAAWNPCRLVPRFPSGFLAQRWFQLDSLPTFTRLCYCFLAFQVALDDLWPLDDASDSRRVPFGLCFVISLLLPPKVSLVLSIGLTVHFLNCFYLSHSFVLKC